MVGLVALGVLIASSAGLLFRIEPIPTWYYQLAWWSYIVAIDSWNRRLSGSSLLRDRPRRLVWLAAVSVLWWTLFEAINLRIGNWYYVMDPPQRAVRWLGGVIAFATVLPGIVETFELIGNLGLLRSVKVTALRWSRVKERLCLGLGVLSLGLPLIWPDLFFPLVWGSFVFLLAPLNRRGAEHSFLRDLERGEAGAFCRALAAGLICGLLWELWNFWARTQWIYTVPVVGELKLFEMPLLGFLGFPPFAVESLVLIRWLDSRRRRSQLREWPLCWRRTGLGALLLAGLAAVFLAADHITVDSYYHPIGRLETLAPEVRHRLTGIGITSPEQLLGESDTPQAIAALAGRCGLPPRRIERSRERVELIMHRGLGLERARQLERIGIRSLNDLAGWRPEPLAAALRRQTDAVPLRFIERRARVWLQGLPPGLRSGARSGNI